MTEIPEATPAAVTASPVIAELRPDPALRERLEELAGEWSRAADGAEQMAAETPGAYAQTPAELGAEAELLREHARAIRDLLGEGPAGGGSVADHPDDCPCAACREDAPAAVVVATNLPMQGVVLRWYRNLDVARYFDAAVVTVSRSGVQLNGGSYLHDIPAAWIADAQRAVEMLQHGQPDRAAGFATHEPGKAFRGELVEVKR